MDEQFLSGNGKCFSFVILFIFNRNTVGSLGHLAYIDICSFSETFGIDQLAIFVVYQKVEYIEVLMI
jgi:hypothetical protein